MEVGVGALTENGSRHSLTWPRVLSLCLQFYLYLVSSSCVRIHVLVQTHMCVCMRVCGQWPGKCLCIAPSICIYCCIDLFIYVHHLIVSLSPVLGREGAELMFFNMMFSSISISVHAHMLYVTVVAWALLALLTVHVYLGQGSGPPLSSSFLYRVSQTLTL